MGNHWLSVRRGQGTEAAQPRCEKTIPSGGSLAANGSPNTTIYTMLMDTADTATQKKQKIMEK